LSVKHKDDFPSFNDKDLYEKDKYLSMKDQDKFQDKFSSFMDKDSTLKDKYLSDKDKYLSVKHKDEFSSLMTRTCTRRTNICP